MLNIDRNFLIDKFRPILDRSVTQLARSGRFVGKISASVTQAILPIRRDTVCLMRKLTRVLVRLGQICFQKKNNTYFSKKIQNISFSDEKIRKIYFRK